MTIRIRLAGCSRYSYGPKGELFEKGFFYDLDDEKARTLLTKQDDYGRPYFVRVETPVEDEEVVIESTQVEELEGVKIKRSRGRPRKSPQVLTGGDTSALEDEARPSRTPDDAGGIEV